jgi:hypothetical protein
MKPANIFLFKASQTANGVLFSSLPQVNGPNQRYKGMLHAMKTVAKEEGPRALYKGWLPSVIGVVSRPKPGLTLVENAGSYV